jgi:tRNA(fMet)-specific endonuclease VapC
VIHLDTSAAIALLNNRQPQVRACFDAALVATRLAMSVVVYNELMFAAANSAHPQGNEDKVAIFIAAGRIALLAFAMDDAREAADIRAHLKRQGTTIGAYDVLIAVQARRSGATVVTANTSEFERVPGLAVVNWAG